MTDTTTHPTNRRTLLYPLAALAIVFALVKLRPERDPVTPPDAGTEVADGAAEPGATPSEGAASAQFDFLRKAYLEQPPDALQSLGIPDDVVEVRVRRALTLPIALRNNALNKLAKLEDPAAIDRFVARAEEEWRRDPLSAYIFLPALAQLGDEGGERIVLEAATHPRSLVRQEAARSLGLLDDAAAASRLEQLVEDPDEAVRSAAIRSLIEMSAPEAYDVLVRYAEKDPEERMKHVLFRLGQDVENPGGIPVLRRHLEDSGPTRLVALHMLARLGDPSAIDVLNATLKRGSMNEQYKAMIYLIEAPKDLLDEKLILPFLDSENGEMRRVSGELILRMAQAGALQDRDEAARRLEKRLGDLDYRARQVSIAALHALGRKEVLEPYLKAIATAGARGLRDALEITTVLCKDERALPIVLERLGRDPPPSPEERSMLITALGDIDDPKAIDAYLAEIRSAAPGEVQDGSAVELSKRAALHVSRLGPRIEEPLLAAARDRAAPLFSRLRALDSLRGVIGLDCVDALIELARDPANPRELRLAAIDTITFVDGAEIFEPLREALDSFDDREVRVRAFWVLLEYS